MAALRSQILLAPDKKASEDPIIAALQISRPVIGSARRACLTDGLQMPISDNPQSGQPVKYGGGGKAKWAALACSIPPDGFSRRTARLLAEEFCQLTEKQVSRDAVRLALKKQP
jgi:hypothetical protein